MGLKQIRLKGAHGATWPPTGAVKVLLWSRNQPTPLAGRVCNQSAAGILFPWRRLLSCHVTDLWSHFTVDCLEFQLHSIYNQGLSQVDEMIGDRLIDQLSVINTLTHKLVTA